MSNLAEVTQKDLANWLNKIGLDITNNLNEITSISNQIKVLNASKKKLEEANSNLLNKVENKLAKNYENIENGVTTDKYEFPINKGQAATYDEKKLNVDKVPDQYIIKSISKQAIKAAWAGNNHKLPTELTKLGIKIEETKTISCKEIKNTNSPIKK